MKLTTHTWIALSILASFVFLHTYLKIENYEKYSPIDQFQAYADQVESQNPSLNHQSMNKKSKEELKASFQEHELTALTFWETWCAPCEEEMPALEKISQTYTNIQVVGVYLSSDPEEVQAFIGKHNISFAQVHDQGQTLHKQFDIVGYPTLLVVDQDQNILLRQTGFKINEDGSDSLDTLRSLIEKKSGKEL